MKILLVSGPGITLKQPYSSGVESFMISFAKELSAEGHLVHIVAKDADFHRNIKIKNPFKVFPKDINYIHDFSDFVELIHSTYDILHFHMFYPELINLAVLSGKPVVITLHTLPDEQRILAYKKIARNANVNLVAISERMKKEWESELGFEIDLIQNGIDISKWNSPEETDKAYLLWSARITEEKNVNDAISLARYTGHDLVIAGRIVDHNYFEATVRPYLNQKIRYAGHLTQPELCNLAGGAMAYLATAVWQEPFGLAPLEMLACGIPIVGYKSAVPEEWRHESVLTSETQDWKALVPLLNQSAKIHSHSCKAFAATMSLNTMTSEYMKLYQTLLSIPAFIAS